MKIEKVYSTVLCILCGFSLIVGVLDCNANDSQRITVSGELYFHSVFISG